MSSQISRPGLCWYCGQAKLRTDDPPEHVIPDSMGGRLTTDRVCAECNHRAGREIDGPFMKDMLIFWDRQSHLPGGAKLAPRFRASLADGTPVNVRMHANRPWTAEVRGGIERDGDQVRIRATDQAEYCRLLKRLERDLAEEGKSLPADLEAPEPQEVGPITISSEVDGVVWLRMAAKVTLGTLSKSLDERWVLTAEAAKYRGWLWDPEPTNPDGSRSLGLPAPPTELDLHANHPPEHLIVCFVVPDGRVLVSISYFGSLTVHASVDRGGFDMPGVAYRTWHGKPAIDTPIGELLQEAALAMIESHRQDDHDDDEDGGVTRLPH